MAEGFNIRFLPLNISLVFSINRITSYNVCYTKLLRNNGRYIVGGDISLEKMFEPASKEQIDYLRRYMGPTSVVIETRAMARTQDGNIV